MPTEPTPIVRLARPDDAPTLVDYNARLAEETEGKALDPATLARGVARALADPDRLRYWVAEVDGRIIGQAAASREWSDWRDGWIWWLQSVYVHPDSRARGIFRALYGRIRDEALATPDVIGLRLYVEDANERAQQTYRALGMVPGGYQVFEEIWPDRLSPRPG